jgi:predicted nucleic acid-binding protein
MTGVLIDMSVWVDHFQRRKDALVNLLNADLALTHPMVQCELACGTPPAPRTQTLQDIGLLQQSQQASIALAVTRWKYTLSSKLPVDPAVELHGEFP